MDTFRTTTLHILKHFGVSLDGLELKIESRGAAPLGGGEVVLVVPIVANSLTVSINHYMKEALILSIHSLTHTAIHFFTCIYSHKYASIDLIIPPYVYVVCYSHKWSFSPNMFAYTNVFVNSNSLTPTLNV